VPWHLLAETQIVVSTWVCGVSRLRMRWWTTPPRCSKHLHNERRPKRKPGTYDAISAHDATYFKQEVRSDVEPTTIGEKQKKNKPAPRETGRTKYNHPTVGAVTPRYAVASGIEYSWTGTEEIRNERDSHGCQPHVPDITPGPLLA